MATIEEAKALYEEWATDLNSGKRTPWDQLDDHRDAGGPRRELRGDRRQALLQGRRSMVRPAHAEPNSEGEAVTKDQWETALMIVSIPVMGPTIVLGFLTRLLWEGFMVGWETIQKR